MDQIHWLSLMDQNQESNRVPGFATVGMGREPRQGMINRSIGLRCVTVLPTVVKFRSSFLRSERGSDGSFLRKRRTTETTPVDWENLVNVPGPLTCQTNQSALSIRVGTSLRVKTVTVFSYLPMGLLFFHKLFVLRLWYLSTHERRPIVSLSSSLDCPGWGAHRRRQCQTLHFP